MNSGLFVANKDMTNISIIEFVINRKNNTTRIPEDDVNSLFL